MRHKLILWRIYNNNTTRTTGECKTAISTVTSIDDLNVGQVLLTILKKVRFDDGGVSGIGKQTDIKRVEGPNIGPMIDAILQRQIDPRGTKALHHNFSEQVVNGAQTLRRTLTDVMSRLDGEAACIVRVFHIAPDWRPVSSPSVKNGVYQVNRFADNDVERYSDIAFLVTSTSYYAQTSASHSPEAL